MYTRKLKYYLHIIILLIITYGCSYKWRATFFDGVPEPEKNFLVLEDSILSSNDTILNINRPTTIIHKPYHEKNCFECHDNNRLGKLKMELPNLCYQCHEIVDAKFSVGHGPVSSGNCTQCHSPHLSKNDNLLLNADNDLCFNCHSESEIKNTNGIHNDLEKDMCIQCHNAHGSNNKNILKSNTCFNCHDDFRKDMTFIHGPVEADNCSICHTESHSSNVKGLLFKNDNQLCFECHNNEDIQSTKNIYHQNETENCLICHDSHAGQNKYLLIQTNKR